VLGFRLLMTDGKEEVRISHKPTIGGSTRLEKGGERVLKGSSGAGMYSLTLSSNQSSNQSINLYINS